MKKDTWECPVCLLPNDPSDQACKACEAPKPGAAAAAPKKPNAFAALLPKNVWTCKACLLDNKAEDDKCASCEAPRPASSTSSSSAAKPSTPKFQFGITATAKTATPSPTKTNEEAPKAASKSVFGGSAFGKSSFGASSTFGISTSSTPSFGKSSFGVLKPAAAATDTKSPTAAASSFGSLASGTPGSSFAGFGAAQGFGLKPTGSLPTFAFDTKPSTGFSAKAKSSHSDKFDESKAQASGTDNDSNIYKVRAKLYIFGSPTEGAPKKFMERGVGDLQVNKVVAEGATSCRMIMR